MRWNLSCNESASVPHQQGLAQARNPFQQHVPAGDQGQERAVDDRSVADNHLADLPSQGIEVRPELVELLLDRVRVAGHV